MGQLPLLRQVCGGVVGRLLVRERILAFEGSRWTAKRRMRGYHPRVGNAQRDYGQPVDFMLGEPQVDRTVTRSARCLWMADGRALKPVIGPLGRMGPKLRPPAPIAGWGLGHSVTRRVPGDNAGSVVTFAAGKRSVCSRRVTRGAQNAASVLAPPAGLVSHTI